jgi:hypothetical protein
LEVFDWAASWYWACSKKLPMSTTEKKTEATVIPENGLDTEALLLQRLNNTTTEEEYFRWMLFVVGFYRGINKISEAIDLLDGFIKSDHNSENKAHCHLALGQIATDEKRFAGALEHLIRRWRCGGETPGKICVAQQHWILSQSTQSPRRGGKILPRGHRY